VPSIYLKKAEKQAANPTAVNSLARFECAQHHSISNEQARVAFVHDHGGYCKASEQQPSTTVQPVVDFYPVREDRGPNIPAEVGKSTEAIVRLHCNHYLSRIPD